MKYTDELDKVSYSLGLSIASNLISSGVTTINAEAFIDGLNVVFSGKMPEIIRHTLTICRTSISR